MKPFWVVFIPQKKNNCEICVSGHLDDEWGDWLEGLSINTGFRQGGIPITKLSGPIKDQASLHGIFAKIRDMGIPIIPINFINPEVKGGQHPYQSAGEL